MHTTHLPTIHASVATRGQYWWQEGPCTVRSSEQVWTDLQWWPPDVTSRGPWSGQVPMSGRRAGPGPGESCTVRSHAPWIMVTWGPPPPQWTDRHDWKHYLPATSLAGDNEDNFPFLQGIQNGVWTIRRILTAMSLMTEKFWKFYKNAFQKDAYCSLYRLGALPKGPLDRDPTGQRPPDRDPWTETETILPLDRNPLEGT